MMTEYYAKFRRGDMNLDDKLDETEFLYFEHPEHNPQSIKDLVEDMISNFDKNNDKVWKSCSVKKKKLLLGQVACCSATTVAGVTQTIQSQTCVDPFSQLANKLKSHCSVLGSREGGGGWTSCFLYSLIHVLACSLSQVTTPLCYIRSLQIFLNVSCIFLLSCTL